MEIWVQVISLMKKVRSMEIKQKEISATGIKFYVEKENKEVARF